MVGTFIAGFLVGTALAAGLAHRKARKDVEMLGYLAEHGASYGREIRKGIGMSDWNSPYPRLYSLERRGLVMSHEEDCTGCDEWVALGHVHRRLYRITDLGKAFLRIEIAALPSEGKDDR